MEDKSERLRVPNEALWTEVPWDVRHYFKLCDDSLVITIGILGHQVIDERSVYGYALPIWDDVA